MILAGKVFLISSQILIPPQIFTLTQTSLKFQFEYLGGGYGGQSGYDNYGGGYGGGQNWGGSRGGGYGDYSKLTYFLILKRYNFGITIT